MANQFRGYSPVTMYLPFSFDSSISPRTMRWAMSVSCSCVPFVMLAEVVAPVPRTCRRTALMLAARSNLSAVAAGFEVTAVADDGVVEAIEHRTKPIVGVQFHPERLFVRDGDKRALALIKAALEGKGGH